MIGFLCAFYAFIGMLKRRSCQSWAVNQDDESDGNTCSVRRRAKAVRAKVRNNFVSYHQYRLECADDEASKKENKFQ